MTVAARKADPAVARRRSAVLGLVEERMRALIDAGIRPTVPALKAGLGPVGVVAIRRARAELIAAGVVRVPGGLVAAPAATAPEPTPMDAAKASARGLDVDEAPRPRPRPRPGRVGPFRREVREALRRERAFLAWSLSRKGGGL